MRWGKNLEILKTKRSDQFFNVHLSEACKQIEF